MPNLPISQLPSLTNPQLSSVIPISEGSATYKTTLGAIVNSVTGYYGSFYHTASMVLAAPNAASTMSFNSTDLSNGVSISGSFNDKLKFTNAGVYNVQFSAQLDKGNGSATTCNPYIWIAKNGTDIPATSTSLTLAGGSADAAVAAWNWFVNVSAGDYIQLKWSSDVTNVRLHYEPAPTVGPVVPSIILTANRVS
jgi:hypothetical protein